MSANEKIPEQLKITFDNAVLMLPAGDKIEVQVESLGQDWFPRDVILHGLQHYSRRTTTRGAWLSGYRLAYLVDEPGVKRWIFILTNPPEQSGDRGLPLGMNAV